MTYSAAIDEAIVSANADGIDVLEITTGWTKVREVVSMAKPMTDRLFEKLSSDRRLRYWETEPTPHNKAEQGFTDDEAKVGITFPRS